MIRAAVTLTNVTANSDLIGGSRLSPRVTFFLRKSNLGHLSYSS